MADLSAFCICMIACAPGWHKTGPQVRSLEQQAEGGRVSASLARRGDGPRWRPKAAADAYSRFVVLLKRALPAFGGALLLLIAAWPRLYPLFDSVRQGFAAIDLREARELKMLNPRYAGTDRLNRPYVVTAAVGRQVPNHDNLMSLDKPPNPLHTLHAALRKPQGLEDAARGKPCRRFSTPPCRSVH